MLRNPKAIVVLLTALNLLNYVDRFILAAVLPPLRQELHLSGVVSGWLPTFFLLGYFATSPIFGHLADRGGRGTRSTLLALGVGVWSLATVGSGLAQGALGLCVARALVGVGEASYATLAPTLIDEVAPPEHRGKWMAVFSAATPVGSALGYVIGGHLLGTHGWRTAFFVVGAPGLLAALLCLFIAEPRRSARHASHGVSWREGLVTLASVPLYRSVVLGYCAYSFAIGGFAFWAPTYLHLQYGLAAGRASLKFGLVALGGGALGTLLGGALADRAVRKRRLRAPRADSPDVDDRRVAAANLSVTAVSCALGAPLAAAAIAAPSAGVFFGLALPCLTALFVMSGPINVAILKSAPPHVRARAMGVAIFAIHALGDLWSPPLLGWIGGWMGDRVRVQLAMYLVPTFFALGAAVWWPAASSSERLTTTARVR